MLNQLQLREIFHLEFLRCLNRKVKLEFHALKGGTNLRFFFNSFRYSEDMDLDIYGIRVSVLRDIVMEILQSSTFLETLKTFDIERIIPPNIIKAKQTQTTQRFKVHLVTSAGEDLFTKIEFSRRGLKKGIVIEPVSDTILRTYKLSPLLISHYDIQSTVFQKIEAIASRTIIQARDIFDLYILSTQYKPIKTEQFNLNNGKFKKAHENILEISFEQFKDTVIFYLSGEDQTLYNSPSLWDEIKLKVANFIEELKKR